MDTIKIVAGEGERWIALQFPNGRFGVKDRQRGQYLAAGLDEADAVEAVKIANNNGRWHPALIHAAIRENRAKYGWK